MKKVTEEIHQTKLNKEVGNFLASGVLGLVYVIIKVSHHDGFIVPEA